MRFRPYHCYSCKKPYPKHEDDIVLMGAVTVTKKIDSCPNCGSPMKDYSDYTDKDKEWK